MIRQLLTLILAAGSFAATSAIAQHEHSPEPIRHEHMTAFSLVTDDQATHHAMTSGAWSDPATWMGGNIPTDGAKVIIGAGVMVDFAQDNPVVHKTIRVDGHLRFATDTDTVLRVDTLIIGINGHLQIGTVAEPVEHGVRARIIIADTGPIDLMWDPLEFSRGMISHGRVTIHGEAKTSHADLAEPANRRDKELVLDRAPTNWSVGDVLILPGSVRWRNYDETLLVTAINDHVVSVAAMGSDGQADPTWRGLNSRHNLDEGVMPFVMNVSRNVSIESENVTHADAYGINRRRGHIMYMHSGVSQTDTRYVGAYGMGRTDKRTPLESPELDDDGHRVADRGHNAVGRYAWHFHRGGPENAPAIVEGLAIVDSPGLGLVNHSSNVEVTESVAFNVVGSAWFTEAGNEVGFFHRVVAARMPGSGEGVGSRTKSGGVLQEPDFGHGGHGFWLQGGGVSLHDVRVAGAGDAGIIFFTEGLDEGDLGVMRFDATLLDDAISGGSETLPVGSVPLHLEGALVHSSRIGIETKFHQLNANHDVRSRIEQVVAIGNSRGLSINYTNQLDIVDSAFIGNLKRASGNFMQRNKVTRNITFDGLIVRGWSKGLDLPVRGTNRVIDGDYQNVLDICISTTKDDLRLTEIEGDVNFMPMTDAQLTTWRGQQRTRRHIYLITRFNPEFNDLTRLFARDIIRLGTIMYQDKQLYYFAQAADFVPFPDESAAFYVPEEIRNRTNAELYATYGLAIGDAIAPAEAYVDPVIYALIGQPMVYPPQVKIRSRKYTNVLTNYRLKYWVIDEDGNRQSRKADDRVNLDEGWNIFTVNEAGFLRTHLVFGDIIAPTFLPDLNLPAIVNPLDLKRGFRVKGQLLDNSFGSKPFKKTFKGHHLTSLPVVTLADGTQYVELIFTIKDFARNTAEVAYLVELDEEEPLAHTKRRKALQPRTVTLALYNLLATA